MKTFYSSKLNLRFPISIAYSDKEKTFEIFERGVGMTKYKKKDFIEEEIEDFKVNNPGLSAWEMKEYVSKYGKFCGYEAFRGNSPSCDMTNEKLFHATTNFYNIDKNFCEEFYTHFKIEVFMFYDFTMMIFGMWFFDLPGFDDFLHIRLGYREENDGSTKEFLIKKFGAEFAGRFELNLVKSGA